ncbi:MAG: hypothetical protein AABZ74_02490 [Cyanobacteriota bacterium]
MKKLFLTFLFFNILTFASYSKDLTYVSIGDHQVKNTNELNKILTKNDYPAFTGNSIYWGTGSRNIVGKVITGSENSSTLESKILKNDSKYSSYLSGKFSSILHVGYSVYSDDKFNIYPIVGLGLGTEYLDFYKKPASLVFEDILKSPENGSSFLNTSIISDIGIATDYVFRFGKKENQVGIAIGLKAGYVLNIYSLGFNLKDYKISNAPNLDSSGFYVKFFAGYEEGIIPAIIGLFS